MTWDNEDRYGKMRRDEEEYELGEASPGDVGDSEGSFHDRARKNNTVIADGKAQHIDDYSEAE
jgi:hypothetical protein